MNKSWMTVGWVNVNRIQNLKEKKESKQTKLNDILLT